MKRILICLLIYGLWTMDYGLIYAQTAKIKVPADVSTETIILDPQPAAPAAPVEGQIYYNDIDTWPYYYGGTPLNWRVFGQDRTVATRIVAASNSDLSNKTADYICNGTADQVKIQQAIDALGSNPGVVYLLEGTYNISSSINLNNTAPLDSGKAIIGAGAGTVLRVVAGSSNVNVINASDVNRILILQLRIDGNKAGGGSNCNGIRFSTVTSSKIDKVWVENMIYRGISIENSSNNNSILGNSYRLNGGCGITIQASSNNIVSGNIVWSNSGHGIHILRDGNVLASNNTVSSNSVLSNSLSGIMLEGSSTSWTVSGNTISGNNVNSSGADGISLTYSSNNTITANMVWSSTSSGIYLYNSSSYNTVTGNNAQGNSQHGIYLFVKACSNTVLGNNIYDNGGSSNYDGIKIDSQSDNNLISSNLLYDSGGAGYPINITNTKCGNNYLVGNLISSWPSNRTIRDFGPNTRYTDKLKVTLEPGGYTGLSAGGTLTSTGPSSYLRLNPTTPITLNTTTAIADGKSAGDNLILENISANTVTINDNTNVQLYNNVARVLGQNDTLTLIWNGADWIETGFADN